MAKNTLFDEAEQRSENAGAYDELVRAGSVLSREKLVTAFGHVSVRTSADEFVISPPTPLNRFAAADALPVSLREDRIPYGAPQEAWIHQRIYQMRGDVNAICRAQPFSATALASAGTPIRPLHGQGAFLGAEVPIHFDSLLVRNDASATDVAHSLKNGPAVILRGNGAVTVADNIGNAVALMWVLETSAAMNATAVASGRAEPLSISEQRAWRSVASELLPRIWKHLSYEESQ